MAGTVQKIPRKSTTISPGTGERQASGIEQAPSPKSRSEEFADGRPVVDRRDRPVPVQFLRYVANAATGDCGQVWQPAYHDHALRAEDDLLVCARYLVANPVRAELVRSAHKYPYWNAVWL